MFDLTGKGALVTGGTSGIGLAMATALGQAGASVAVWGRDPQRGERAEQHLKAAGVDARAIACDVTDEDDVAGALERTVEGLGSVDACFANAGFLPDPHPVTEYPTSAWREALAVNLDGVFFTLRAVGAHMVERGQGGSLVAIGSLAGVYGQPQREAYAVAKSGLAGLVRSLAVELARHDIRANLVQPGWIDTPMMEGLEAQSSDKLRAAVVRRTPLRRFGTPDDFAGLAVYLASDASAFHTGDIMTVDGGFTVF